MSTVNQKNSGKKREITFFYRGVLVCKNVQMQDCYKKRNDNDIHTTGY